MVDSTCDIITTNISAPKVFPLEKLNMLTVIYFGNTLTLIKLKDS